MKSVHQIAKECGIGRSQVYIIITNERIIPAVKKGRYNYYDKYQEEHIHNVLFLSCLIKEITLESKMNKPEPIPEQESWEIFKKRTYGRK